LLVHCNVHAGAGRLDLHTGTININSSLMLPGMIYEFVVIVTSADLRKGSNYLQVKVVDELKLPVISIR